MRRLKHLALLFIALLVILTIVVFMLENQQSVIVTLFGWSSAQVSVSICLVVSLLLGMIVGPILGMVFRYARIVSTKRNI
ncbi:lipopolysaccharide assembly protein LapA domain-containing protein [Pseudomonas sp. LB3P81]